MRCSRTGHRGRSQALPLSQALCVRHSGSARTNALLPRVLQHRNRVWSLLLLLLLLLLCRRVWRGVGKPLQLRHRVWRRCVCPWSRDADRVRGSARRSLRQPVHHVARHVAQPRWQCAATPHRRNRGGTLRQRVCDRSRRRCNPRHGRTPLRCTLAVQDGAQGVCRWDVAPRRCHPSVHRAREAQE